MVFSSFAFLCFFLPVVFVLHTLIPGMRGKNALLIIASILFYAYGEPIYLLLLLVSVIFNFIFGKMLGKKKRKSVLALAVCTNLLLLVVFKYAGFFAEALNILLPESIAIPVPEIRLPIGISFYTFQALSYVIDVYRGDVGVQKKLSRLFLYISFFPQLIAGPIVRYHDIEEQIYNRKATAEQIKWGSYRFICGLGKKILLSNTMAYVADAMFALPNGQVGMLAAWIGAIAYLLQIYFDFSGYSDMAIGLGHMFGFKFQENFQYPYIATSIQDFWRRWHISLSTWFKEYLYIPLGGNRKGKWKTVRNRYVVFLATGLWHGANWTFLLWGLYHGTLLVAEWLHIIPAYHKKEEPGRFTKVHKGLSYIYTMFAVILGFVLFRADTLSQAGAFIGAMFGFGASGGIGYATAVRMLSPYYLFIFVLAVIGATPYPRKWWLHISGMQFAGEIQRKKQFVSEIFAMAICFGILLLCFMALASNSYNPFIYFRF